MVHEPKSFVRLAPYLILTGTVIFFAWLLHRNYFFVDDFIWLEFAKRAHSLSDILAINPAHFYNPLLNLYFWLLIRATHGSFTLLYLHAILLHTFNAYLIYRLVSHWLKPGAALMAMALFALPYAGGEAITWLAALPHLLVTTWLLLSFLALHQFTTSSSRTMLALCHLSAVAALLTKEASYLWPLMLAAYYAWLATVHPKFSDIPILIKRHTAVLVAYAGFILFQYTVVLGGSTGLTYYVTAQPLLQLSSMISSGLALAWPQLGDAIMNFARTHIAAQLFLAGVTIGLGILAIRARKHQPGTSVVHFGLIWLTGYLIYTGLTTDSSQGLLIPPRYAYITSLGAVLALSWLWVEHATGARRILGTSLLYLVLINNAYLSVQREQNVYEPLGQTSRAVAETLPQNFGDSAPVYIIGDYPFARNPDYLASVLALERNIPKHNLYFVRTFTEVRKTVNTMALQFNFVAERWEQLPVSQP